MKTMKIFPSLVAALLLIFLGNCQSMDKNINKDILNNFQVQRTVENNIFTSSFPDIKLRINPDFQYLGNVLLDQKNKNTVTVKAKEGRQNSLKATSYLFGKFDGDKRMVGAVLIRAIVMTGDPNQLKRDYFEMSDPIETGKMKILDEEYEYNLFTQRNFLLEEEQGLVKTGILPSCFLVKEIENKVGLGNKSRLQIFYLENIPGTIKENSCGDLLNTSSLTDEERKIVQGFTDRSFQSIRFMRTASQAVDNTSKYVDKDPKEETTGDPRPVAPQSQTMEEKLKTLKDLHDKNLITDEDYNKKKAELLKDL